MAEAEDWPDVRGTGGRSLSRVRTLRGPFVAALCLVAVAAAGQEVATPAERFTAVAKRTLAEDVQSESALEIVITRWATYEELEALARVLDTSGQEAFVKAVRARPPAGAMHEFLRRPVVARRVHHLALAVSCGKVRCYDDGHLDTDRRRRVVMLIADETDGLSFLQFELDRNGRGEGSIVDAAVVRYDAETGNIHLADARGSRARLSHVRAEPQPR